MALSTRYQTTTPYEGLANWVAAMLSPTTLSGGGGEGLYWGGVGSVDNGYPAFLALVRDDTGRIWPCGSSVATSIEFADSEGAPRGTGQRRASVVTGSPRVVA